MIRIGINENVYLADAKKNDKGTLELTFKQADGSENNDMKAKLEENPFADWEEGTTYNEGLGGLTIRVFPFDAKAPISSPEKTPDATEMRHRIGQLRDPLFHIASRYMTNDKIPLKPKDIFRGTGIDKDVNSFGTKIMSEVIQTKVYDNIVDSFIEAITPFLNNPGQLFRLKLPRQSRNKAFAVLPTRFISEDTPFYEPMEIPAKSSKVKFSKWEIDNGFDKAEPVSQETADKPKEAEPEMDPFANQ